MTYKITVADNSWFVRDTVDNLKSLWTILKHHDIQFREEKMDDYMGRVVDVNTFIAHSAGLR